ncbi:hypothetical protein BJX76DRAFT_88268 [Aspergillus varians]
MALDCRGNCCAISCFPSEAWPPSSNFEPLLVSVLGIIDRRFITSLFCSFFPLPCLSASSSCLLPSSVSVHGPETASPVIRATSWSLFNRITGTVSDPDSFSSSPAQSVSDRLQFDLFTACSATCVSHLQNQFHRTVHRTQLSYISTQIAITTNLVPHLRSTTARSQVRNWLLSVGPPGEFHPNFKFHPGPRPIAPSSTSQFSLSW